MNCFFPVDSFENAQNGISMLFTGFILGFIVKSIADMVELIKEFLRRKLHNNLHYESKKKE